MFTLRSPQTLWAGAPVALVYGLLATWLFRLQQDDVWAPLSLCFVFVLPIVVGALTVALLPQRYKVQWRYGLLMPWLPVTLLAGGALLLAWEVWICVAMALPLFWTLASAGGLIVTWLVRRRALRDDNQGTLVGALLLLPYLLAPVEAALPRPDSFRPVERAVIVGADPATVWETITAVPAIQPAEQRPTAFRVLGLPMPVEAMLDHEGVGGVRRARYSNGLRIVEPVTVWEPGRRFAFEVHLDPNHAPPPPFAQVGGAYFAVEQVGFTLEPLASGQTRLRLASTHRLSTHFNFYGGPWSDFLMGDFQTYILGVLKARAEGQP